MHSRSRRVGRGNPRTDFYRLHRLHGHDRLRQGCVEALIPLNVSTQAGWDPVPSTPEAYADRSTPIDRFLPSRNALLASEQVLYDQGAFVYYWLRGWI